MNRLIMLILSIALLGGCNDEVKTRQFSDIRTICHDSSIENRKNFILECIKNANPYSDEEPEDWIGKCERFSKNLYCKDTRVLVTQNDGKGYFSDVDIQLINEVDSE